MSYSLVAKNTFYQKFLMYFCFFAVSLNVLLNIYFIPKYSHIASAYTTLVSELLVFALLLYKLLIAKKLHERGVQMHG